VLTTLLMVAMIGMLAFAIDLGYVVHVRTELQRTADASALAAAELLRHESASSELAFDVAAENGWSTDLGPGDEGNGADQDPMTVEFGYWQRDEATFTSPAPTDKRSNAVRVTLRRSEATNNPLRLFFARVLDNRLADVAASATAWSDYGTCGPFVGIEWLTVGGGMGTDSFDSIEAPYREITAGFRGSICSDGPVNVGGNSLVKGDALAGEGYSVDVDGTAVVTGYVGSRLTPLNMPPVDASDALVENDNDQLPLVWQGNDWRNPLKSNGDFSLNAGEVYDVPPGTYCFDNVTLNGGSTLNFYGPTIIYVTGKFSRHGGAIVNNNTQIAENLQILSTGGTMVINSDNEFYGVIYAPQSDVTLNGDADFFGACVGATLKINGTGTGHYDEDLDLEWLGIAPRTMLVD
jgi:Flp pilus assembly protein TadG